MNAVKAIRNNWKKSVFFAGVLAYGGDYGYNKYRINQLMVSVCAEAINYGNELLPPEANNRHVIVILNPTANKRSAEAKFEKYCAPILNLSGIRVDVVKTESEGFARTYVELTELPDAIVVAGGDGTISEVVTGLMRRNGHTCPIGVLPLGRASSVAKRMFSTGSGTLQDVEALTNAAMSIVRGRLTQKDVMKIEQLPGAEEDNPTETGRKPIYALGSIKWGALRDAISLQDKYWYYGGARAKAAILFNSFRSTLNWNCAGQIVTTPPCSGCATCFEERHSKAAAIKGRNWWSFLVPRTSKPEADYMVNGVDVRTRHNPVCGMETEIQLSAVNEVYVSTSNVESISNEPVERVNLRIAPANVNTLDWIRDSWQRTGAAGELNSDLLGKPIPARSLRLIPERKQGEKEEFYSIDNEDFEVKPIRITLLPRYINVFT